jgi:hypothetical protein
MFGLLSSLLKKKLFETISALPSSILSKSDLPRLCSKIGNHRTMFRLL